MSFFSNPIVQALSPAAALFGGDDNKKPKKLSPHDQRKLLEKQQRQNQGNGRGANALPPPPGVDVRPQRVPPGQGEVPGRGDIQRNAFPHPTVAVPPVQRDYSPPEWSFQGGGHAAYAQRPAPAQTPQFMGGPNPASAVPAQMGPMALPNMSQQAPVNPHAQMAGMGNQSLQPGGFLDQLWGKLGSPKQTLAGLRDRIGQARFGSTAGPAAGAPAPTAPPIYAGPGAGS